MTPRRTTRPATLGDARAYASKAHEFLQTARASLELGNNAATAGNAVHAGIAAADAIAAARSGTVWRGEHGQASRYLESVAGGDGRQAARHLGRLLPLMAAADYDPHPVTSTQARSALQAAARLVEIADRVLGATP